MTNMQGGHERKAPNPRVSFVFYWSIHYTLFFLLVLI